MKVVLKTFRADVKNIFHHIAESDGFRITGDCSIHSKQSK